jgi:hypothetical protein
MTRRIMITAALWLGTVVLCLSALLAVAGRSIFSSDAFADHTARALEDPGVRAFVADRVTSGIIGQKPDLVAVRPFVLAATTGLVGTRPFEGLVRQAAKQAHRLTFSEGVERVVVVLPDVGVLVRGVLEQAGPGMAEKIPRQFEERLASIGNSSASRTFLDVLQAGHRFWTRFSLAMVGGLLLLGLSVWLEPDRRRGTTRAGLALAGAGLVLAALVPVGRLVLGIAIKDPLAQGAAQGVFVAYLGNVRIWATAFLGVGLITAAGGAAFLDRFEPLAMLRRAGLWMVIPPARLSLRLAWGVGGLVLGILVVLHPSQVAAALVALAGVGLAYGGLRELFRMLGEWVASVPAVERVAARRGWSTQAMAAVGLAGVVLTGWLILRNPMRPTVAGPGTVQVCNGSAALCDLRLDEVTFAGAHNAMSNQSSPDWMFPHHPAGISTMLEDGIRALAIDIHYGIPGGVRIKTELRGLSGGKLHEAIGDEQGAIAERIRNTLVGGAEGEPRPYFCHGFCELGAYEPLPTLEAVRDFLVSHPDEVIIVIIEDYTTVEDLVTLFDRAGLTPLVFRGPAPAAWPTLRELIESQQRVIVFLESGRAGAPWLMPTAGQIQETPYTFKKPEDFSCVPNRGGTRGALFLMNHWIETTPTPKPSNAEIVNARDVLLRRALQCQAERQKKPNILLVDFYRAGDVVGVAAELNGIGR